MDLLSLEKLKAQAQGIPDRLQTVVSMADNVLTLLANTVNRFGGWLILALMIIIPFIVVSLLMTMFGDLAHGLRLLFGLSKRI
ncbi:hypothetical protein KFU94_02440 [Chloroflexi bacterium TSY]|nr:hypothetical protein [Chloroflexi bacterium TSY]